MSKSKKSLRMAPLQRLTVKPIDDPAEQAALDARMRQSEEAVSRANMEHSVPGKVSAAVVLELCHQLSTRARLTVASELAPLLSLEQLVEVLERWASQLPAEARRNFADELLGRLEDAGESGNSGVGNGKPSRSRGQDSHQRAEKRRQE